MEYHESSIVELIEMKMIRPSQFALRDKYQKNDDDFRTLVNSIHEHGLLQPILIRPFATGFEIVAGHRRFQACKTLKWRFIPSKIRELADKHAFEIQLTENIQRKSMDPIEEAEAFRKYVVDYGWGGVTELARKIGKSDEYVSHHIKLLKLPEDIKQKIASNSLKVSQAIEIAQMPEGRRTGIINSLMSSNLTVRQIRELKKEEQFEDVVIAAQDKSRSFVIAKKTSLALKITLTRIDDIINEVHTTIEPDQRTDVINFLMGVRLRVHSLIDESIRFTNVSKPREN